ncbi:MAG: protein-L-isoaspartate(D-aspartate) O-methyltransferase [Nitrospirae bacterium]|nr:protein-L-isoaspartate(D-aspartate) O-methyltransferase [Nitrospirota bacterium]
MKRVSDYPRLRKQMIDKQLVGRGIRDPRVLAAFMRVQRHRFVPEGLQMDAYDDKPLPIGEGQTISQPFIVAAMVEALQLAGKEKVLEIGTGSGYMTAILAELCEKVFSIERIHDHAIRARKRLEELGYTNIAIRAGDGTHGWRTEGPFDAIIVSASSPVVPPPLVEQINRGGKMILPLGDDHEQRLTLVQRIEDGGTGQEDLGGCRFVRLIGEHGWKM